MNDFLSGEEADKLFFTLQARVRKSSHSSEESTSPLALDLTDFSSEDEGLLEQITFLKKKIEKSTEQIFDLSSSISKVIIRRLPRPRDYIPYEQLSTNDENCPHPMVTLLSLGAPRALNLKKGSHATHKVILHPGSLCAMAGKTSQYYSYSIPRCNDSSENEHLLLFFVGSPSGMTDVDSDHSSVVSERRTSESATESEVDSEIGNNENHCVVEEVSLFSNVDIPKVVITPDTDTEQLLHLTLPPQELNETEERISDILDVDEQYVERISKLDMSVTTQTDQVNKDLLSPLVADQSLEPEGCEKTIIHVENQDRDIKETLFKAEGQSVSTLAIKSAFDVSTNTDFNQLDQPSGISKPTSSMIEDTLIDLKTELQSLGDQVLSFRQELDLFTPKKDAQCDLSTHTKEVKQLKDLWQQSLINSTEMKDSIEANFKDIAKQEEKLGEFKNHIDTVMADLDKFHGSAFFREDSKLIKELHKVVVSDGCYANTKPTQNAHPPLNEREIPSMPAIHPTRQQPETTLVPESPSTSRRGTGFTLTNSAPKMPLPVINITSGQNTAFNQSSRNHDVRQGSSFTGRKVSRTVLITDSILRHVRNIDSLGVYHELHQINKRDSSGLMDEDLQQKIQEIRPDYIYVHLGINDVHQAVPLRKTLQNFLQFKKFTDSQWGTQVILSLPLLTADPEENPTIEELRDVMREFVNEVQDRPPQPLAVRKLWLNPNNNFIKDGAAIWDNHSVDGTHLSDTGKNLILGNFRHYIHHVARLRLPQNTSGRERLSSTSRMR